MVGDGHVQRFSLRERPREKDGEFGAVVVEAERLGGTVSDFVYRELATIKHEAPQAVHDGRYGVRDPAADGPRLQVEPDL